MSQPSQPPLGGAIKAQRRHKKQQEQALRARQLSEGLLPRTPPARPKACSAYATVAQEQAAREEAVTGQMAVLRRELPPLLERLEKIPDLRAARLPPPPRAAQGAVPRLPLLRLLDGLYAKGPVMHCWWRQYNWQL